MRRRYWTKTPNLNKNFSSVILAFLNRIVVINKNGNAEIAKSITIGNIFEDKFSLSLTSLIEFTDSLRYYLKKNEINTPKKSLSEINLRNFLTALILFPKL